MNTATLNKPAISSNTAITLTPDQEIALTLLNKFMINPKEQFFVLSGYSGCGKSTLIRTFLDALPLYIKMVKLVNPKVFDYTVQLTATTNKAAENLAQITGSEATTIHSFLGLRVSVDFKTGITKLIAKNSLLIAGCLVIIDEASYIDKTLLGHIKNQLKSCKVIFVGDPAQLIAVKATDAPVFDAKYPGAALTTVVRQVEGNPIIELGTMFRHTVNTGIWPQFKPDGKHIQYLNRDDFNEKILQEFTRSDWHYKDSKILAWTNKCVIDYNNKIRSFILGDPEFVEGDYAVCNSSLVINRKTIKTDQLVHISQISKDLTEFDVLGNFFILDSDVRVFVPKTLADRNKRIKKAKADEDFSALSYIETSWADLRAAYAQTINKAQGSTYGSVFIDLDDISRCNIGDSIARMLYVATTRAKNHVFLTGDISK